MRRVALALGVAAVAIGCLAELPNAINTEVNMRHHRTEPMGLTDSAAGHFYDWRDAEGIVFDDSRLRRNLAEARDDAWADNENDQLAYERVFN